MNDQELKRAGAALTATDPKDAKVEPSASPNSFVAGPLPRRNVGRGHAQGRLSDNIRQKHQGPAFNQPQSHADSHLDYMHLLKSGVVGTIHFDEFCGGLVRYLNGGFTEIDDIEITRLVTELEALGMAKVDRHRLRSAVSLVGRDNSYDSAIYWLNQLPPWDGIPRVSEFLPTYLGTANKPYEQAVGRYWWTAMVARILQPGCKADMMPVLVGPQGVGKSTLLSAIAPTPEHCGDACLTDRTSRLNRKVQGKTIVVWEEMRGIRGRFDADEVKTFISNPVIDVESKSNQGMELRPRRFVLVGTSNRDDFLRDPTGHRRYLPFEVKRVDLVRVKADKIQIWAEAFHIVQVRLSRGLSPVDFEDAELLAQEQVTKFAPVGRWVGNQDLCNWLANHSSHFSTEDALKAVGLIQEWQINQQDRRDMATTLRQLKCKEKRKRVGGVSLKRWFAPGS